MKNEIIKDSILDNCPHCNSKLEFARINNKGKSKEDVNGLVCIKCNIIFTNN